MYKYVTLFLSVCLLSTSVTARELSKEQKKQIKDKLKEYKKHPEKFDSMVRNYKETIDSNEAEITRRKETIDQLSNSFSDLQGKMSNMETELKTLQNRPIPTCPECPNASTIPQVGTIYKVQLGLFKKFDMNGYFNQAKFVGVESVDKMNRYVISYFEDKTESERFVKDLRKLGLKGAFSAKYENGQRVFEKGAKPASKASASVAHHSKMVKKDKEVSHPVTTSHTKSLKHKAPKGTAESDNVKVVRTTTDRAKSPEK